MFAFLVLAVALSQAPPEGGRARTPPARVTDGELVNMLDAYAIVQAQNALQIDDNQFGEFVTRLKRLQQGRRRAMQRRHQIIQELRKLTLESAPDDTALRTRLKALHDHDVSAADELRRAYEAVDEVLTPRQQARFRIFEEQMERRKLDLLMRARNRSAPPRKPDGS
jgi:hypothetical protein